jgi:hypothetical protein
VDEHVPEQEEEDPRGERAEPGAQTWIGVAKTSEREPEEDRQPGDRTEDEDAGRRQSPLSPAVVVRPTLHDLGSL